MLKKLAIHNYAIIDKIEVEFSNNLNVITGETGAGKSILVGALSLILGERADTNILQNRDKKCIVEGYFSVEGKLAVKQFLNNNELDNEEELVLRREISTSGKSRGFINDTPATLQQLKELTSLLVDLHQQFDTLELGDSDFQREVLDALAGNHQLLINYQSNYRDWQHQKNHLEQLLKQQETFSKELDYHQYVFNELDQLNLKENELEDLEVELKLLSNSEGIKAALTKVYEELKESEHPLVQQIKVLANQLQGYAEYHHGIPVITERLRSAQVELQDIADEVEQINDHVVFDEERIEQINEKLSAGYKLLKKHNVQTTNQLIAIKDELANKLNAVLNIDELISTNEQQVKVLLARCDEAAKEISNQRKNKIALLEKKVNALLQQVGMPNAKLKVQVQTVPLHLYGSDNIEFLFDANKSNRFVALRKVASGGELSRLMLCIKSLIAQSIDLPTLIFDEIDTGISGEAAKQVGVIMKELAVSRQLITITHQPQIAGKADAHYFVYKEIKSDAIKTNIRHLTSDERITTIAKMLSGEKPTAAALENAREMMN